MANPATEKTLAQISTQLSKKGESWLETISGQLESKGTGKDDPFAGFKIPKLTDIAKGLTFGLAPGLIKKSVAGMQIFMDSLNSMNIDDLEKSSNIIKLVSGYSDAMTKFGNIPWLKALKGTFLLQMFSNRFKKVGAVLGSDQNLNALIPFKRFAMALGIPLKLIGNALSSFAKIKWTSVFISTKFLKGIMKSLKAIAEVFIGSEQTFERMGEVMEKLTEPLIAFGEAFKQIGNTLLKASISLLIVAASLGLAAISLKQFADVNMEHIGKGISTLVIMMGSLAGLSFLKGSLMQAAGAVAIVAAALGIAALSMKLFAGTDFDSAFKGVGLLAAIMGGLVAIGLLLSGPQIAFVAAAAGIMALVGVALIPFAYGLKMLSGIKWDMFDGIFTALSKLAAGALLLTLAIPGILATSVALIPFAASLMLLRIAVGKSAALPKFLETFKDSIKDLDGGSLISASKGILALSGALVAFAGSQVASGIGTLVGKILRFGSDSPIEQLIKLAKHGYNLSILGMGVRDLANGLKTLAGFTSELDILETLADRLKGFDSLDPTGIKAFAEGINMLVTALTALSQLDGKLNVLNSIPFDKLKSLSESIKPGAPLIQIVNGLKESEQSKETAVLLQKGIQSKPPTVGTQLGNAGTSASAPVVIINNNNGGNVTNNSSTSSNVNNNGSVNTPIVTASGSGMFISE